MFITESGIKYKVFKTDYFVLWKLNGQHHRIDGPALVARNGKKEWWVNGRRHRVDGPAVISPFIQEWWIDNVNITNKVKLLIEESGIPTDYTKWDNNAWIIFRLKFC